MRSLVALLMVLSCASAFASDAVSFRDRVRAVSEKKDAYEVSFRVHAAIYCIPKNAPGAEKLAERARKAAGSRAKVSVRADVDNLTIEALD